MVNKVVGAEPRGAKLAADLVRDFPGQPFNVTAWETWLNQATPAP